MSAAIPWWRPETGEAEARIVREVLDSQYLNEGGVTADFERELARRLEVKHAVAVTSGTSALALTLMALGIGPGDEVVVPDLTFIATANAVYLAGARPVLADVDPDTLTLRPESLEQALTPRTKAVIPVHVSGRAGTLGAVLETARRRRLQVVEDAAEALFSRWGGRFLGTHGTLGCFSFSPNKTITTGQGGLVVTQDEALHGRLRELKDQGRPVRGTGGDDLHPSLGFNFKLTNLQAAVGLAQLDRLAGRLERQKRIHSLYREGLAGVEGIRVLPFDLEGGECPQWTDALADRRDALVRDLSSKGAECRRFWLPLHTQKPYLQGDGAFPNSTRLSSRALWLPSAFQNTDDQVRQVCGWIRAFYGA